MMLDRELHVLLRKGFYYSNRAILQQILALGLFPGQPKILEFLLEKDGAMAKEASASAIPSKPRREPSPFGGRTSSGSCST